MSTAGIAIGVKGFTDIVILRSSTAEVCRPDEARLREEDSTSRSLGLNPSVSVVMLVDPSSVLTTSITVRV
jgi:hypothetical protein